MVGLAWGRGDNLLSIVLIALLGIVYYLSRLSVWQELDIAKTLYPADRTPNELQMESRWKITGEVFVFYVSICSIRLGRTLYFGRIIPYVRDCLH